MSEAKQTKALSNLSSTRQLATFLLVPAFTLTALLIFYKGWSFGRDNIRCWHRIDEPGVPACPMGGYAWLHTGSHTLFSLQLSNTPRSRWGSELSRYWQARGMAKLGGLNFRAIGNNHHWLRYLPKRVSAPPRNDTNCTTFERACAMCYDWRYSHKCLGAWTELGPEIIRDTRAALEEWARENGREVPQFTKDDVVVQNRCSAEVWLNHPEYGPAAFSLYEAIPPSAKNIFIVVDQDQVDSVPPCAAKLVALHHALQAGRPGARVATVSGDVFTTFSHMVYAPTFFKDSSSSFGLWAGMANNGTVWSPRQWTFVSDRFENPHWRWSDAPVLYPAVAEAHNLSKSDLPALMKWLQTN